MIGSDTISLLNPLPAPRYLRSASFTLSLKRVPSLDRNHSRKFAEESSKPASPIFVFIKKIGTTGKLLPGESHTRKCVCVLRESVNICGQPTLCQALDVQDF